MVAGDAAGLPASLADASNQPAAAITSTAPAGSHHRTDCISGIIAVPPCAEVTALTGERRQDH